MAHRVSTALSDWANETTLNGLSDWTAHDFASEADRFLDTLAAAVKFNAEMEREGTEDSYRSDVREYIEWELPEEAIDVGLFEVGPEYTGLEFDER